ncbi:MAG TPA: extracellular solute-binding protein [Chloroflexota bacterium]|nr:extracellular solute-binding protein [Chloroflexota bacterium]
MTRPALRPTRRALLARGLSLLLGAAAAACDQAQPGSATPVPTPARRLSYLGVLAPPSIGRPRRADAWNLRYGADVGIILTVDSLPGDVDPAAYDAALSASGAGPPIVWLPHESVPALARRGALRALDAYVKRDRYDLKAFMPCALQPAYGLDGHLYALPETVDAGQLYFNRQHLLDAGIDFRRAGFDFERPNSHWEGLRRAALDLMLGRQLREIVPWHPSADGAPLEVWGWANGGGWLTADGRRATFTRDENVAALSWLVTQASELGGVDRSLTPALPAVATSGSDIDPLGGHPFLDGRTTLWFDSGRFVSTMMWVRPEFPIGYVESPRRTERSPLVTWARSGGYALRPGAPDALWPALRFFVTEDAAIVDAAAEATQAPQAGPLLPGTAGPPLRPQPGKYQWYPPFTGQLRVDKFLASRYRTEAKIPDEGRDHALEQLRHARPRERCLTPDRVWPLLREARLAALRGTPPREALEIAQQAAQRALDEAGRGTR